MTSDLQQLRQRLKTQRLQVLAAERERAAENILAHCQTLPLFQQAKNIAAYIAVAGEIPTQALLTHLLAAGKSCYLPCVFDLPEPHLRFAEYHATTSLIPNRYRILEPDPATARYHPIEQLDCVLVPLVAYDQRGHRLGMGAGYYDRTFASNKTSTHPVPLIGLAYSFQLLENFAVNAWDVPLTGIVTELGYQIF